MIGLQVTDPDVMGAIGPAGRSAVAAEQQRGFVEGTERPMAAAVIELGDAARRRVQRHAAVPWGGLFCREGGGRWRRVCFLLRPWPRMSGAGIDFRQPARAFLVER